MKRRKRNILLKRIVALIMAVTMLPFADYGQVFAYSGQNSTIDLSNEQTAVSENTVKEYSENQNSTQEQKENNGQQETNVEENQTEERDNGEKGIETQEEVTKETSGLEKTVKEPWMRITKEELEHIQHATFETYEEKTIDSEALVLTEDLEVGNLYINGESLDLNGYTLIVYGDLLQTGGEVRLNGGKLIVGKDYRIQTREEKENPQPEEDPYIYKESNGKLVMTEETDYLVVCGSFYTDSTVSHEGSLTAGIMEVMGNFTQLSSQSTENFMATESHKVIFSGEENKEVTFSTNTLNKSQFSNVEIGCINQSENSTDIDDNQEMETEDKPILTFTGNPYVSGEITDTKSHTVIGKIGIGSTTGFTDGYFGGGAYILEQYPILQNKKITLEGDIEIAAKVSIYGILETKGNVLVTQSGISMEGGELLVGNNLTVKAGNHKDEDSGLKMYHDEDYVLVGGDFLYQPWGKQNLSAGVLEIKGNATIEKEFQANGSHKTVFSGEKKQVISMADGMYFHILELKNESPEGVYSEKILSKNQLIRNGCQLTYGEMEGSFGYTLKQDEVIEGDFILLDDTLDLNGYSLRIKGNLVQASGVVVINGGLLTVEGDYRQQGMTTTSNNSQDSKTSEAEDQEKTYGVSNGYLQMTNEADQVLINGSMYVETTADTTGKLTNGVLEVKGDFIQKKTEGFNNFKASDNHTLVLSGEEKQTLNMEYSILNGSQICNLEMKNAGEQGVVIENRPYIAGMITDSNKNTTGQIAIGSNTQFVKGYFGGSVYTLGEIAVRQNLDVCGNMDIAQNVSIYADLTVRGNVVVNPGPGIGGISMEGGKLTVGKNLTINQYTYGIKMANDNDYILVYGDFTYQPRDKWDIKAGTLEIKGNVNIVKNFFATGTHKTILSGKSKQTVTMADGMYFHILELQNYSEEGIYSEKALQKSQLIRNGCKISYGTTEGNYGETLEEDKVVEGDYILLDDILDLNGHSLTIKGDFVQPAGEVYINGGTLIVEGDYRQQSTEANDENEATGYGVSSGLLRMEKEEDHVLIKGSMYIESAADTTGKLKNGVLEIKGDFIQKKTTKLTNFAPSDNHVLLLSGEGKQTVNMEYSASGNSHIENLEITNSSADGITFENSPYIAGIIKSQQGQNTAGQIKIGSGTTLPAFYPGDVCSLEEITIKEGEEVAIGGNLEFTQNLSIYGCLSVGGNVDVKPVNYTGGIIMEGGSLKVGENLTVHPQFNQSYGIQMTHESDYLLVGGNFTYNPEYEWKFNAGTLELKGDVDIKSCFHADGTHKTILSGESKQTVTMADGMYFHILELQNYSEDGVYSDNAIQKSQLIRNGCKLTYGNMAGSYGYTLEQDQIIESDFTLVDDVLDLNGHTLTIKGDLIQSGGEVFVNGGKLIVEGDYRQQSYNSTEKSYGVSSGLLHMENEADYVLVSGNMYIQTTAVTTGKLANGVLEVKGDFIQKKTSTLANFNPSDSHILLLSGQVKQTVSMEYTAIGSSHIQNLQITNNNEMGISFQNCPYVAGTITSQKGQTVAGQVGIGTSTILQNGYYPGDICILQEITVKEDEQMEIGGNLKITQNLSIFGSVQVDGNIEVRPAGFNGGIIMEGGSLKVGKNLEIYPENTLICGIQMLHESDYILVKGDFSYNPGYEWDLTAGTLELKGNANISTCFHAKNKHKTILSGESKQTITMADGMYFNILEIQNYSEEGVYSETALQKTQLIRNGCKLTYGDMEGSYGYTLEKDETIEEDFILIDDVLNLNGHTLTIKGDFIQPGGEIFVNGGALIVEGDYRQQSKNTAESGENENYGVSSGLLHMKNEDDYVLIKGNMYVETKADTVGKLTNGTLEVKGDFVQKKTATLSNFNSSHSHTLVLSGEEKQTVTMEYTDDKNSYITNLEIDNNSEGGIVFENSPYVAGNITAQKGQKAAGQIGIGTNTRLQNGYFPGDVRIVQGIVINAEDEYEIGGNLEINQKLSICGSLCVGGNIDVKPSNYLGGIVMQGGSLKVEKNLNTYVTCNVSYGIQMIHESDYIFVGGDFNYGPGNELALTAGTLELKGNADITSCFHAKGTHKTILSGESKQTITMADGMYFNILELQNYSDEGVYSQKALQKAKLIRNGCKLTYGDMKDGVYGFTLQDDYVAEGNLILIDDVMDLNGHTLTIRGNLIQAGGEILINGGTLIVEGDYRQQTQKTVNGNSTYEASSGFLTMTNENDTVEIAGDFIMQQVSGVEGHFTKGTLNIKGNFQQIGANGFVAEKNHTVCFNGEETQKFINETNGIIGNLTIENTSKMGVVQSSQNKVLGTVTDLNNQLSGSGNLIIDNFSQLAEGNCGGNVTITGENTLESNIEIEGIITVDGTCKLNGYELCANACTINGSLYVEGGSLLLTSYLNVAKKGYFVMTDAKGYAFVNGDMTFATKNSHSGLLTNGILEVKGDFTQKAAANFIATENHTTILSKKTTTTGRIKVQTISFSHPGEARFHKLILKKSLKTGYIFHNTPETIADEVIYQVTDETAPDAVGQVSVGNITASTIHISYVAATDNNAVAGYEIYRNGKKIAVTNTLSYTDTGLTPETTYTYTVYAFDEDKNLSEASKEVQATTLADELAPDQVTGLSVISSAGSSITLSWKPSADNVKTTHYTLYRDGELVADNLERTKYTDSGLKENKLYIYTITASDKAGNVSQISEEVHGVVTMPKFTYVSPEDYATIGGEQVMLEARFSSAGNSIGNKVVMEYLDEEKEIWKQITPTPLGQKVYDSSQYYVSYPWDISGFAEEKEIDVRFTLTDKDGKSKETLVTYSLDRTAPNPPRNLQITDSEGTLKLTWDRSTSADVAGTIIRRQKDDGAFEIIADITDVDMEWYIDKDVETGAIYTYTLQCYDKFGQRGTLSSSATDSPLPDESAPTIEDMLPVSSAVGQTISIQVKAKDNRKVENISLYGKYKEEEKWQFIVEKQAENDQIAYELDTANYTEGEYQIKAVAKDKAGNTNEELCFRTYTIDHTGISKIML
ncbi:MAG: hypothetical protein IJN92_01190, partial [Lachnospiraceae bacterium]|nr:hypothetical protein [Lachnospiraceae bacterium]